MDVVSLQLSSIAYLLAAGSYVSSLLRPAEWARRAAPLFLGAAFLLHTVFIVDRLVEIGSVPVTTFTEGLSFLAWLLVGVYMIVQSRYHVSMIGAVVSPLAFVLTLAAFTFYTGSGTIPESLRSPWLAVHVGLAFLGNAVFGLAFAASTIYLLQESLLKSRSRGWMIQRLPALERLDRLNHLCLAWGFPLLTLGIVTGGIWAESMTGAFWSGEPREVLSVLTWLLYAGLLQLRLMGGLRGRRAARLTILGFCVLLVSFVAVNLLPASGRHGGGFGS